MVDRLREASGAVLVIAAAPPGCKPNQFDRQCARRPRCGEVVTCLAQ